MPAPISAPWSRRQHQLGALRILGEQRFVERLKWDLYIKPSLYAQYYFGLRSLSEKASFRQRYNATVVAPPHSDQVAKGSQTVKQEVLSNLSRSM